MKPQPTTLRFGSVCSGIEAASVAWAPLGWRCAFASEIEAFPRAVLKHRHPGINLHGDFTSIQAGNYEPIDLLVGGTPCQSFSVAGLRGGLADDRGNLALEFLRLAQRLRPRWLVWENVPGVLSSNGGRDFGSILGGMGELGYGVAYRVLDAQFFGVAQRRRRVFVVGHIGDWRRATAVLFERHSLSGNPPPRRATREGTTYGPGFSAPSGRERGGRQEDGRSASQAFGGGAHCNPTDVATAISAHPGGRFDLDCETFIAATLTRTYAEQSGQDMAQGGLLVAHSLRGEGFDASEDGTGRGTPLIPVAFRTSGNCGAWATGDKIDALTTGTDPNHHVIAFSAKDHGADAMVDLSPTLRAGGHDRSHANAGVMPAVAFALRGRRGGAQPEVGGPVSNALRTPGGGASVPMVAASAVRRLTPRECERLQGFPDDYTMIPWRGGLASDGPRYKALGNSMAVPVMAWIGQRIAAVDALQADRVAA